MTCMIMIVILTIQRFLREKKIKESRKIVLQFRAYVILSQRSVRLISFFFLSFFYIYIYFTSFLLPLVTISSTNITAYMVLLLTSRFNIFIYSIRLLSNVDHSQFINALHKLLIVLIPLFSS